MVFKEAFHSKIKAQLENKPRLGHDAKRGGLHQGAAIKTDLNTHGRTWIEKGGAGPENLLAAGIWPENTWLDGRVSEGMKM